MAFKNITAKNFDTKAKTKATNEIFDNINKFSKTKGVTGTNRKPETKTKGGKKKETNLDNFIL